MLSLLCTTYLLFQGIFKYVKRVEPTCYRHSPKWFLKKVYYIISCSFV